MEDRVCGTEGCEEKAKWEVYSPACNASTFTNSCGKHLDDALEFYLETHYIVERIER